MTNWLLVSSPENFEKSREIGFRTTGMKSRHRRKWERVKPGDRVFLYLTGAKAVAAVCRVTGDPFESHETIWRSSGKPGEDYPWRFPTEPVIALEQADMVPAEPLARRMEYTRRWPEANWTLAFQGNVHELNDADAELLESAIREASTATERARTTSA